MSVAGKQRPVPLAHVSILASAGSGKTFQLTNRYIKILARGAAPSSILASTFTRAAAGEIRDRILNRIAEAALSAQKRRELGKNIDQAGLAKDTVLDLLAILAHNLHRLQIRTLDSFFGTIVRCFALELGLPTEARIVDEDEGVRLRREAIRMMLDEGDQDAIIELLASLTEGSSERAVTDTIDATVSSLYELYREALPSAWSAVPPTKMMSDAELDEAIAALKAAVPSGPKRTINAHQEDCERVEVCRSNSSDDWKEFFSKGLAAKVADGSMAYYKQAIEPHVAACYFDLLRHAHAVFRQRIITQTKATHDLLGLFHRCYLRVKHRAKVLTFADLTAALAEAELRGHMEEVCFRIDARLRHVLLDEMQDTNIQQWNALRPIVDETVSYPADERSFFCVGDVKQSIYGWRDACPEVLSRIDHLLARPGGVAVIERQTLATSYRSAQPVIDAVNRVFESLRTNAAVQGRYPQAAESWIREFEHHSTAKLELPGYVELRTIGRADDQQKRTTLRLQRAADLVADLYMRHRDAKRIGVLCRTNAAVSRVLYELGPTRRRIPATGRGGGPLTDAPAVNAILDLLRVAEHPDHTVASFNVLTSPLGPHVGLVNKDTPGETTGLRRRIAARIRRQVADDGLARTIQGWVRAIAGDTDERQYRRCMQLIQLAQIFDQRAASRIDEFVHMVESRAVADPAESTVQVMTVHQSKGLEFDIVILPELESEIAPTRTLKVVYERDGDAGPITRIARHVSKDMWQTFPDLAPMFEQHINRLAFESLCLLYVALTRARQGLFMLVDPPSEGSRTIPARLSQVLLCALAEGEAEPDQTVYAHGDAAWLTPLKVVSGDPMATAPSPLGLNMPIAFAPTHGPLLRLANLLGDDKKTVGEALTLSEATAGIWGAAIKALFAAVDFLGEARLGRERLITLAQRAVPSRDEGYAGARVDDFLRMLEAPALAELLSRGTRPASARVEHELPFARLVDGELQQGILQRVVMDGAKIEVVGFSHDKPATPEAAAERAIAMRALARAWRDAAVEQFGVSEADVTVDVAFVAVGYVARVI
ncbi:MAG: UvrD-helicase domain-containing protein [Nannocystaceae bacterium]